jgi:diguanylate cyclase (GGDEF)-like protein
LAAGAAGFALLIQRGRAFAVVPMARELLFAELPDPALVLDARGRVVEANPAAFQLEAEPPPLDAPLASWPRLGAALTQHLARYPEQGRADAPLELQAPAAWYEVQQRRLDRAGRALGALVLLHDVSRQHQAQAETERALAARDVELGKAAALQALLREQAMHDPLTGLLNRRALEERFAHETGQQAAPRLALVLLDLDHFKRINDRHGHARGDAVLRDFGSALRGGLRASDALFRIGGEEFALLLPGANADSALRRVESLRTLVASWQLGGLDERVTFSAGVAAAGAGRSDLNALLQAADAALYEAKNAGRNRSVKAAPA